MRIFAVYKAKRNIRYLYEHLNCLDEISYDVIAQTNDEIKFKYKNITGKFLVENKKIILYTLFDIYEKDKIVKKLYHYKIKKKIKPDGEMVEFSRSGTLAPGPC